MTITASDLGSQISRRSALTDENLLALPTYRASQLFAERDKLILDQAALVAFDRLLAREDSRVVARRWIESHPCDHHGLEAPPEVVDVLGDTPTHRKTRSESDRMEHPLRVVV